MWNDYQMKMTSEYTSGQGYNESQIKLPATLGACSAFNFLTRSPCCVTRVYGQEAGSVPVVAGAGVAVGGAMPGLYSRPVSCLNCT